MITRADAMAARAGLKLAALPWDAPEAKQTELAALQGECERLSNDLCNAPTKHNRRIGAVTYTVRMARRELGRLAKL